MIEYGRAQAGKNAQKKRSTHSIDRQYALLPLRRSSICGSDSRDTARAGGEGDVEKRKDGVAPGRYQSRTGVVRAKAPTYDGERKGGDASSSRTLLAIAQGPQHGARSDAVQVDSRNAPIKGNAHQLG